MDPRELWINVLNEIELAVSKATFNTWFRDTFILKNDAGVVSLAVPNSFVEEWLKSKHHRLILRLSVGRAKDKMWAATEIKRGFPNNPTLTYYDTPEIELIVRQWDY